MKVRLARCREAANELRLTLMGPLRREEAAGDRPFVDADIHRVDRQHAGESVLCDPLLSSAKRREHATGEPAVQRRLEDPDATGYLIRVHARTLGPNGVARTSCPCASLSPG